MNIELPKSLPRDEWVKTTCEYCGKINEQYWDADGFPIKIKWRCLCAITRPRDMRIGNER